MTPKRFSKIKILPLNFKQKAQAGLLGGIVRKLSQEPRTNFFQTRLYLRTGWGRQREKQDPMPLLTGLSVRNP
jgi:hypothetical protein